MFPASLFPLRAGVPAIGALQPASIFACSLRGRALRVIVSALASPDLQSRALAVAHPVRRADLSRCAFPPPFVFVVRPPCPSDAFAVGHEVQALSDVRRADARSAQIERPDGVTRAFQVRLNKVEPRKCVLACNLLAKDDARASESNEMKPGGPYMPLIIKPAPCACRAERLARAGAGPDGPIVGPSGLSQGEGPDSNAGEEMALGESGEIVWRNISNVSFVNFAGRDMAGRDEVAQPLRRIRIDLVVIGAAHQTIRSSARPKMGDRRIERR